MIILFLNKNKQKQKIIRLKKKGIIKYPLYDIIVTYKNFKSKGKAIEKIGFFNPQNNIKSFSVNNYRLSFWLLKGVIINYTIRKYLVKFLVN